MYLPRHRVSSPISIIVTTSFLYTDISDIRFFYFFYTTLASGLHYISAIMTTDGPESNLCFRKIKMHQPENSLKIRRLHNQKLNIIYFF